jgi:carboxyl-terminal processing protease
MTREEIVVPTVKGYSRKPDNTWDFYCCDDPKIAYLRITQFTSETFDNLKPTLEKLIAEGMRGLILDVRFNPGGRLDQAIDIVDLFVDHGVILSTKGRSRPEQKVMAKSEGTLPYFPMIVLVNEHSASASEIVAGSLMDNKRALVIGQRTYGKGSVQELIPLDNKGGELKLTVAYYYLPSGRLVHKKKDATDWGVQPQIVVPMDPQQEQAAMKQRYEQEIFRKPVVKSTTRSATAPATTQAGVVDQQLQRAIDTMIALVVLVGDKEVGGVEAKTPMPALPAPVTMPTQPATGTMPATGTVPSSTSTPTTKQELPPPSTTPNGSLEKEIKRREKENGSKAPVEVVPATHPATKGSP